MKAAGRRGEGGGGGTGVPSQLLPLLAPPFPGILHHSHHSYTLCELTDFKLLSRSRQLRVAQQRGRKEMGVEGEMGMGKTKVAGWVKCGLSEGVRERERERCA